MCRIKRRVLFLLMMLLLLSVPVSANAAFSAKATNASLPGNMKVGSYFSIRGTVTANAVMKKVIVSIYNDTTRKQYYTAKPNSKSYRLSGADAYLLFNKLAAGTYYYRVDVYNASNQKVRVINKKFSVTSTQSTTNSVSSSSIGSPAGAATTTPSQTSASTTGSIKITNPKPSADLTLTKGASYTLSGTISSTIRIKTITATVVNTSTKKTVLTKTVTPNTTSYYLVGSQIDAAMTFNTLAAGTYQLKMTVKDAKNNSSVVMNRKITVKAASATSSTTAGSTVTSASAVNSNTPANFTPRTTRPAATNNYYYNKNCNIYYKYNYLGPTGSPMYTGGSMYVLGNCTWYACGRAMEIVAKAGKSTADVKAIFGGDPVEIFYANIAKNKFRYGSVAKVGALVVFNYGGYSGDAHIAVVEKIEEDGTVYVSESGYTESYTAPYADKSNVIFMYQNLTAWGGNRYILGYIYLI